MENARPVYRLWPERYNALHTDIFDLTQLGGKHFARTERLSLSIAPPLAPTETMRTISARARNLNAANAEILDLSLNRCDGSVGCPCPRCTHARTLLARGLPPLPPADARPAAPEFPPPRLRTPTTIAEDTPLLEVTPRCRYLRH